jgi:hypothetical protein
MGFSFPITVCKKIPMTAKQTSILFITNIIANIFITNSIQQPHITSSSTFIFPQIMSSVSAKQQIEINGNDPSRLKRGLLEIIFLLDHWDEKTIYCNFGEFQRELLSAENKQELMKAAASTGLLDYDKSATMKIMCRSDPEVVRAFLGLAKDNLLLSKADELMRKPSVMSLVNEDELDSYVLAVEDFSIAVSAIDTLGYTARTDYSSTETQTLEQIKGGNGRLKQTKDNVVVARDSLAKIVNMLHL